jgi:hypothetical protein
MESNRQVLEKQFREQQEKFTYYVIALCVAAIGYSVHATMGQTITISMVPLGIAVLFWGLSIFTGFRFISYTIAHLYTNIGYIDVLEGNHPISGQHPEKIKIGKDTLEKVMEDNASTAFNFATWQMRFFYLGMLLFIAWRIWEMLPKQPS